MPTSVQTFFSTPTTTQNLSTIISHGMFFNSIHIMLYDICSVFRLRKEYRSFNEKLGQTGAGLRYEDIDEGSNLQNLVGE